MGAYVRILGGTQREAGEAAGVTMRTVGNWERSDWWDDALAEARELWLTEATAQARKTLLRILEDTDPETRDARTVRWLLERVDERLLPPKQRQEITGKDGGPIEVAPARERLEAKIRAIRERRLEEAERAEAITEGEKGESDE